MSRPESSSATKRKTSRSSKHERLQNIPDDEHMHVGHDEDEDGNHIFENHGLLQETLSSPI